MLIMATSPVQCHYWCLGAGLKSELVMLCIACMETSPQFFVFIYLSIYLTWKFWYPDFISLCMCFIEFMPFKSLFHSISLTMPIVSYLPSLLFGRMLVRMDGLPTRIPKNFLVLQMRFCSLLSLLDFFVQFFSYLYLISFLSAYLDREQLLQCKRYEHWSEQLSPNYLNNYVKVETFLSSASHPLPLWV